MKYKFWDVSRDRRKAPITKSDRVLEMVALMIAIVAMVLTGVFYSQAPDTVPSHFNVMGEADGWSNKSIYWIMALIFLVGMGICATAAYNRKLVNLPVRLKEPVFYHQIGLIGRMCRVMTIGMGLIWLVCVLSMSAEMLHIPTWACALMILGGVFLMLGSVLFYTLKIWWIGRNCE